jgi:hypothetical protein
MPKCDTHMRRPLQGNPSHTSYRHANGLWNVQWRLAASGHAMPCSRCALHGLGCFATANRSGQAAETGDGVWKVGKGGWLIASRYCCTLARMYHFIMGVLRGGGGGVMRSTCVVLSCPASVPPPIGRGSCFCSWACWLLLHAPRLCFTGAASKVPRILSAAGEVHRWRLPPWCTPGVQTPS